jgi:CubicO group peptidase (beta-lactamase class C family)
VRLHQISPRSTATWPRPRDWHVLVSRSPSSNDSLVFAKGYGVIELGKPGAADAHTRFAIGSTTKAMTSASLAMLVDEGKLR